MSWAPGLVRFAARYTDSIEDAEDAYQRAMEIALTKAPVVETQEFTAWLHTVIRREATTLSKARHREVPVDDVALEHSVTQGRGARDEPLAVVEWRDRYTALQDALHGLTESQRICLMFRSAGASYEEIVAQTGFTERKVHRAITEARSRLRAWEVRMASGEECTRIAPLLDEAANETAEPRDRRLVSRHIRHCPSCRARFRSQRDQLRLLGSLVPGVLLGSELITTQPPDPGFALSWWERVSGSATMKSAQAMQVMMDVPAIAASKAGAGAIAVAAAGAIGTPVVVDAVREAGQPASATIARVAAPATATKTPPEVRATAKRGTRSNAVRPSTPTPTAPTVRVTTTRPAAKVRVRVTSPPRRAQTSRPSSPALEFGP